MQITSHSPPSSPVPSPPSAKALPVSNAPSFAEALAQANEQSLPTANRTKPPGMPPLFRYADDGVITISEMRSALATAKADYQKRLSAALSEHGVKASGPDFQLATTLDGRVQVVGNPPDKARIEACFASDAQLSNLFRQVIALAEHVARGEETVAFHQAYDKDPEVAVAQFAYLFDTVPKATITHRWGTNGLELLIDTVRAPRQA